MTHFRRLPANTARVGPLLSLSKTWSCRSSSTPKRWLPRTYVRPCGAIAPPINNVWHWLCHHRRCWVGNPRSNMKTSNGRWLRYGVTHQERLTGRNEHGFKDHETFAYFRTLIEEKCPLQRIGFSRSSRV